MSDLLNLKPYTVGGPLVERYWVCFDGKPITSRMASADARQFAALLNDAYQAGIKHTVADTNYLIARVDHLIRVIESGAASHDDVSGPRETLASLAAELPGIKARVLAACDNDPKATLFPDWAREYLARRSS